MTKNRVLLGFRFVSILLAAALVVFAPALTAAQSKPTTAPSRVVAIGDIHGDYDSFVALLQRAGLIDTKLRWSGGKTTLVQTGDFLDRGAKDRAVMDLLMALEKQAPKKGGRVVVLLGNHEVMNLMGDLRYVSKETYASYAATDKNAEKARPEFWKQYVAYQQGLARARGGAEFAPTPEAEKAWWDAHPLGYFEQRAMLAPNGTYGRWLRAHAAVARVGGTLFLHGGISPALNATKIEDVNKRIADEIASFDFMREYLVERKLALSFFTIEEVIRAAQDELDFQNGEIARKASAAAAERKQYAPDAETRQHIERLTGLTRVGTWYSVHPDGPLWFRGYATWTEAEGAAWVTSVLAALGAERIVVGHTPQKGSIQVRFGGRVFLIDTGMLATYYAGGRASALEMARGQFTAIYSDQRVTLDLTPKPAGSPSASPQPEETETLGGGIAQQAAAPASVEAKPAPAAARIVWYSPAGQPLPFQTPEEVQEFLRTAQAVKMRGTPRGIAGTRRVTLEKDGLQMNAAFRAVNEEKSMVKLADGRTEMNFRDAYIFEQAAYELALMLGLDNVPPTVERTIYGEKGTLQAWVEGGMVELERQKQKIAPPHPVRWNHQVQMMRVFDNLIYNSDRNMGNIVIDRDWKLWMIDHTRAFRRYEELKAPEGIVQCDRRLFEAIQALDGAEVAARLKKYLRPAEIEGMMIRRDRLVAHIRKLIAERGEDKILFTLEP